MDILYFPCSNCGKRAFTIRDLCEQCAPTLHANYRRGLEFIDRADELYKAQTGKTALEDWDGFEEFYSSDESLGGELASIYQEGLQIRSEIAGGA